MKSISNINYPIAIEVFIDDNYRFTYKTKSENTIKDLKSMILHQTGLYSINYLLMYSHRDYSNFDTFKLREVFMSHKEVQINLKSLDTYKKGNLTFFNKEKRTISACNFKLHRGHFRNIFLQSFQPEIR